ncbi:MAG: hypothetical protein P8X90_03745 [Desulfobacterales bacterium]
MNSEKICNWDGTRQWTPEAVHYPENEEQIAVLIQRALEDEKRIKAVGAALSWSDITDMPQQAIRFNKMDKVLAVDRGNRRVRLQGGPASIMSMKYWLDMDSPSTISAPLYCRQPAVTSARALTGPV